MNMDPVQLNEVLFPPDVDEFGQQQVRSVKSKATLS